MAEQATIDSKTTGDPVRFLPLDKLERQLSTLAPAPREAGSVALLVTRLEGGRRQVLERVDLTPESGFPGDTWGRREPVLAEAQLAVMQAGVADLIANGQPRLLFGDNLFLDLDLSSKNLPIGSRLRAGTVTLEVTPKPHNGCVKFRGRFGDAALRFVCKPELRHLNLRGIYMRVLEGGTIATGDRIDVIGRPQ
jgi:MOSC domain-containing protein YiiM